MTKKGKIEDFLVGQDAYGQAVSINYRGSDSFKTRLGALCTLITTVMMLFNFGTLMTAYREGSKQEEKSQTLQFDPWTQGDSFNLQEQNFKVAVILETPMPSTVGSLRAF